MRTLDWYDCWAWSITTGSGVGGAFRNADTISTVPCTQHHPRSAHAELAGMANLFLLRHPALARRHCGCSTEGRKAQGSTIRAQSQFVCMRNLGVLIYCKAPRLQRLPTSQARTLARILMRWEVSSTCRIPKNTVRTSLKTCQICVRYVPCNQACPSCAAHNRTSRCTLRSVQIHPGERETGSRQRDAAMSNCFKTLPAGMWRRAWRPSWPTSRRRVPPAQAELRGCRHELRSVMTLSRVQWAHFRPQAT